MSSVFVVYLLFMYIVIYQHLKYLGLFLYYFSIRRLVVQATSCDGEVGRTRQIGTEGVRNDGKRST